MAAKKFAFALLYASQHINKLLDGNLFIKSTGIIKFPLSKFYSNSDTMTTTHLVHLTVNNP